jgi:hypothetical protein
MLTGPVAQAQNIAPQTGILCLWGIYIGMKRAADLCFPDQHTEIKSQLADAIRKYDAFIMTNLPTDAAGLAASKNKLLPPDFETAFNSKSLTEQSELCRSDPFMKLFQKGPMQDTMMSMLDQGKIDEFLAVPRKPTINVCM